jgi:hypothetical protein
LGLNARRVWRKSDLDAFKSKQAIYFPSRKQQDFTCASHKQKYFTVASSKNSIAEHELIHVLEKKYRELKSLRFSSKISLIELYFLLRPSFPSLTMNQFQDLLKKLWQQMVIELEPTLLFSEMKDPFLALNSFWVSWK